MNDALDELLRRSREERMILGHFGVQLLATCAHLDPEDVAQRLPDVHAAFLVTEIPDLEVTDPRVSTFASRLLDHLRASRFTTEQAERYFEDLRRRSAARVAKKRERARRKATEDRGE
jgi:hypothetical protein